MVNGYKNYIDVLRHILKNFDDNEFDHIINNILIKIFDIYYLERDNKLCNIDNVLIKYNINMYNLLSRRYILIKSKKIIFIKHQYDKKEHNINLLKKTKILF